MDKKQKIDYWLTLAYRQHEAARALYDAVLYDMMLVHCSQAIEHTIKAYHVSRKETVPRPIHDLERLARACGLWGMMGKEHRDTIHRISPYYIMARYPGDVDRMLSLLTKKYSGILLEQTKRICNWIVKNI